MISKTPPQSDPDLKQLDHQAFMELALALAGESAERGEVPIGAILVNGRGEILARARNMVIELCDPTAHAEILALRGGAEKTGNYRIANATLYVTIEPCPMCAGAMVLARIDRLVFGARDAKSGACASLYNIVQDKRLNHRIEVIEGILEGRCREMIQGFFRARRKGFCHNGEVPKRL
ncbi:MAG: tRNA adenosine(34) deaminase TadA [Dissulfurimicrobium sp.]|uniref:tRNA adenosine(34) deaminase TadA n=1 Tax=Dissulfurimicrobium sp. TaxID=2022436 RepID=UPI003D10D5CB